MENAEIAGVLADIAILLEIEGANPFRIRAYQNAAHTVDEHTTPMRILVRENADLTELPGIGKDMAASIREMVTTGRLTLFDELAARVPPTLVELTRLSGVGPKRARQLWEALDVRTIDDLQRVAADGQVAALAGFGARTQQKILDGIEAYRRRRGRMRLSEAEQHVEALVAYLEEHDAVERLEVAGSYRRRRETIGDIDLLAIAADGSTVMERFRSYPQVARVELSGDTKTTVVLRSGLQVDLRVLPAESYGAALQYFTGSKEHNVRLRTRAVTQGLTVSEYGVFRAEEEEVEGRTAMAGREEEDIYEALGLAWIPPELREDRGEIDAAASGTLPQLVTLADMRGDLQMHSTWSDGRQSIEEMLQACLSRGYEYFAITDHSKALAMTGGLDAERLRRQWSEIEEVQSRHGDIRILRGMEVDILRDGSLDLEDELLAELDVVLVSVHSLLDLPAAEQTARIVTALEHPHVHILAHPTGRLINRRDPMRFDVDAVLQAAVEHKVVVELNAHPDRLDLKDTHLIRAKELGLRVAISTDAHRAADLDLMRFGIDQARRAGLSPDNVINTLRLDRLLTVLARH